VFLAGEWAVAITIVVEEFPANERGRSGIVTSMNTLGGITVGLLAFLGLQNLGLSWRSFYLVGIVALIVVAFMRRGLRETRRYATVRRDPTGAGLNHTSPWEPWRAAYRRNVLASG
jgi:MFS family permease